MCADEVSGSARSAGRSQPSTSAPAPGNLQCGGIWCSEPAGRCEHVFEWVLCDRVDDARALLSIVCGRDVERRTVASCS
jgi:hypothetical protein